MGFLGYGLLWIIFCILVGIFASNKGRSGFGYFILAVIISPLITFVILLALGETTDSKKEKIKEKIELENSVSKNINTPKPTKTDISNKIEQLKKLGELLESRVINQTEFNEMKKNIMTSEEAPIKDIRKQDSSSLEEQLEHIPKVKNIIKQMKFRGKEMQIEFEDGLRGFILFDTKTQKYVLTYKNEEVSYDTLNEGLYFLHKSLDK